MYTISLKILPTYTTLMVDIEIFVGIPSEEKATHTGKIELPALNSNVKHGELQRNMCC